MVGRTQRPARRQGAEAAACQPGAELDGRRAVAGSSDFRSVLAERFTRLVGEAPMRYLANWRMQLAKQLLREGTHSIQEVATRVGYESEAAFNRAFKRATGSPPATWRRGASSLSA